MTKYTNKEWESRKEEGKKKKRSKIKKAEKATFMNKLFKLLYIISPFRVERL